MVEIFCDIDELPIRAASFSPDGAFFAVGTNSKRLSIYSIENILNGQVAFFDPARSWLGPT